MHVGIFGSGKWALLISQKLNDLGIQHLIFGSNKTLPLVEDRLNITNIKLDYVIIASSTDDHLNDLVSCLTTNPKNIYIEKGFHVPVEDKIRLVLKNYNIYFLNQYRFSNVMRILKKFDLNIIKSIKYSLIINSNNVSEWVPHIFSIDNFIRNKDNISFIDNFGNHALDNNVILEICKKNFRKIIVYLDTPSFYFIINFGRDNKISIFSKFKNKFRSFTFLNEDCLGKQLAYIFNGKNTILQKLSC